MPQFTFNPSGDWINDGWALVGTGVSFLHQALAVVDDLKYIKAPASKAEAAVTFPYDTTSVPEGAVITSITIKLRAGTGTGVAPTGTAPTVTVAVASADNPSRFVLRTIAIDSTIRTYEVATYQRDALGLIWDVYRLNQLFCKVFTYLGVIDLARIYQLFCEVKYRVRPTVSVDAPTGNQLTSSPTIAWTYTQADGDPQLKARYKIFTADQVAVISFNPDKTNPVYQGEVIGATKSLILPTSINPDNYYVYVQAESSFKAKSLWAGRPFTVTGSSPGLPGVTDSDAPGEATIVVVPDSQEGSATLSMQDTSNLLSAQDADAENDVDNTQFTTTNGVLVRDTSTFFPGGTASWKLTASSAANMSFTTDWLEVTAGTDITARAQFKTAVTARSVRCLLNFYDDTFTAVGSQVVGLSVTDSTGTFVEASVVGTVPAGTTYARATYQVLSPANAEVHNIDHVGVSYGNGTPWSDGGHTSRNLLSSWYSSPDGTPQAGEAWTAGAGTAVTTIAPPGTGGSGLLCNKMTWNGISPSVGFRAASTVFTSPTSGANFTLNKPAGTATGDLMIAYVTATGYVTMNIVPVGWTLVNSSRVSDGTLENISLFVLKRTATGSEPASWTDGTISANAGCRQAVVIGYTGAADAASQFIAETQTGSGNATPLNLTIPAINNTDPNAWRVSAFAVSDNVSTGTLTATRNDPTTNISYVGSGTPWGVTTNVTGYTINKPTGVVSGDVMVATFGYVGIGCTVNVPSGWTLLNHTTANNTSAGPYSMAVMYKVAGGSEPSSYGGSISGGTQYRTRVTQCTAYRNVDSTTPFLDSDIKGALDATTFYTNSASNTDSRAWRVCSFGGLASAGSGWNWTSENQERVDNYAFYDGGIFGGKTGNAVMMADSNGPVGVGAYEKSGSATQQQYAAVGFIGILKPATSSTPVADETARFTTSSIGSANPYLHLRAFDSNGVTPTGNQTLSGIWAPTTGADKNSMAGWQGLIKPANPVVSGYASATMATAVDISLLKLAEISESEQVAVTASFIGSTAGTPYLTANFYRANVLLNSAIAEGSSFGTSLWQKSTAVFDVPAGTTRMTVGVSASDRAISDVVYWDRVSIGFGNETAYRKGTSRAAHPVWSKPQIQYADDNGTGYGDWNDIPGLLVHPPSYDPLNGLSDYIDHTPIPLTNRKYRARTVSIGLAGDQFVSDYGPDSLEYSFTAENWWLKEIEHPENNIQLFVKWETTSVSTTNTATVFQPIGEDLPSVLTEGYKGDTFSLNLIPVNHDDWVKLQTMLRSGRTLFLQSDIDHAWWVRPLNDLGQGVLPTSSRKSNPLRELKVDFVQVAAPE
jgi:hypothetical protein